MRKIPFAIAVLFGLAAFIPAKAGEAMSEKEKAMASPYPNDLGPEKIDEEVKGYPADIQAGYKMMIAKCAQCHSAARPLNSRFLEPDGGKDDAKQKAAMAKLKESQPEIFKDNAIWQPEVKIWSRYVKRMMAKPGCKIEGKEGKSIYDFLVYDSLKRKTGANAKKWADHRKKLVSDFKAKYPARYKELAEQKDL